MLPVLASKDDVDGALGVELVQFIPPLDHGHVPSEEIDEEPLAVCEHGIEERLAASREMIVDDVEHEDFPGS